MHRWQALQAVEFLEPEPTRGCSISPSHCAGHRSRPATGRGYGSSRCMAANPSRDIESRWCGYGRAERTCCWLTTWIRA